MIWRPIGYYVYTISVDDVVRYIGKGKGLRLYCHMKEVRHRLNRDFRLRSIGSRFQQNLTRAVISGAKVVEQVLVDDLTEKEAYKLEYDKLREYVYAGKRDQLWNVIPPSIQTPTQQQAFIEHLKRNLNSRDRWIRYLSGRTLASLEGAGNNVRATPATVALVRRRPDGSAARNRVTSIKLEYEKLRAYVFAGNRDQLWNVIPASIQTPREQQAFIERLKRNLNSRDRWIRYFSERTLIALEGNNVRTTPAAVALLATAPRGATTPKSRRLQAFQ